MSFGAGEKSAPEDSAPEISLKPRQTNYVEPVVLSVCFGLTIGAIAGALRYRNPALKDPPGTKTKFQRLVTLTASEVGYFFSRFMLTTVGFTFADDQVKKQKLNVSYEERKALAGSMTGLLLGAWRGGLVSIAVTTLGGAGLGYAYGSAKKQLTIQQYAAYKSRKEQTEIETPSYLGGDWTKGPELQEIKANKVDRLVEYVRDSYKQRSEQAASTNSGEMSGKEA